MTTAIAKAVASKSGDDLVQFLVDYPYKQPEKPKQTATERYMDLMDPDPGYTPDTLSEVGYLANIGTLDRDTYHKFLTAYHDEEPENEGHGEPDEHEE
jgi:hypothetical protein